MACHIGVHKCRRDHHRRDSDFLQRKKLTLVHTNPYTSRVLLHHSNLITNRVSSRNSKVRYGTSRIRHTRKRSRRSYRPSSRPPTNNTKDRAPRKRSRTSSTSGRRRRHMSTRRHQNIIRHKVIHFRRAIVFRRVMNLTFRPTNRRRRYSKHRSRIMNNNSNRRRSFHLTDR